MNELFAIWKLFGVSNMHGNKSIIKPDTVMALIHVMALHVYRLYAFVIKALHIGINPIVVFYQLLRYYCMIIYSKGYVIWLLILYLKKNCVRRFISLNLVQG